jgi:hypothetical protein
MKKTKTQMTDLKQIKLLKTSNKQMFSESQRMLLNKAYQ